MEELKLGRVYKIICTVSNVVYVGSTFLTLHRRWINHKSKFKAWVRNNEEPHPVICPIIEEFGLENFKIELIKEYQVCDKKHLHAYETLWICRLNPCNKKTPFFIEYLCKKHYYQENKDNYLDRNRQYYQEHKDRISLQNKQNYQDNKEQISERGKISFACKCGSIIRTDNKARHFKSKKHLTFINQIQK